MITKYENPKKLNIDEFLDLYKVSKKLKHNLISSGCIKEVDGGVVIEDNGTNIIPFKSKIDIVYEDDSVVVVNKPAGILIHSDGINETDTLLNRVAYHYHGHVDVKVIHRIDYDTTGLVLFSKNALSHAYLNYQMENGLIKKEYECIVHGTFKEKEGIIDKAIGSNRHENNKYLVTKNGKKAITKYKVIACKANKSLLSVEILTGRTHQIRVHMAYINHPICSDKIYYKYEDMPLMLMSKKLTFITPSGFRVVEVEAKEGLKLW